LKATNELQKDLMKEFNMDTIDDMVDEMQDMKYLTDEFADAIQRNYEVDIDDEELDNGKFKF
jgi:hypothetical protein